MLRRRSLSTSLFYASNRSLPSFKLNFPSITIASTLLRTSSFCPIGNFPAILFSTPPFYQGDISILENMGSFLSVFDMLSICS